MKSYNEKKMQNLKLQFVYQNLSQEQKQGIIKLWTSSGVLPQNEALRRVEQVSTLVLFGSEIVGVSTAYTAELKVLNESYFFIRAFIKEEYRGSLALRTKLMQLNFFELKKSYAQEAKGIVLELENQKLAHLGEHTNYMTKRGYTYAGKSERALQLWYVKFDEPEGIFINL